MCLWSDTITYKRHKLKANGKFYQLTQINLGLIYAVAAFWQKINNVSGDNNLTNTLVYLDRLSTAGNT